MAKETAATALVTKIRTNLQPVYDTAMDLYISTPEDYAQAGDLLKKIKTYAKTFKAEKDIVLKPIKDLVKSYEDILKPTADQLKGIEALIKGKMLSYNEEQSQIAAEQAKKLESKIESGYIKKPETIVENMAKIETVNNAEAGVTESMVTLVRITDLTQIPAEYFARPRVIDALMVEIRRDALGNKAQGIDPIVIPGTELYQEKRLSM